MRRILVVEDCPQHQLLFKKLLSERYDVACAESADEATRHLSRNDFDLIILDACLPDKDGFSLCSEIRMNENTRDVPLVFVTGRSDIQAKIAGFSVGADDYVVKPFDPAELLARVDAKINRYVVSKQSGHVLTSGAIKLFLDNHKALLSEDGIETELALTPAEFKILVYLLSNEGRVFSREQIIRKVWGENMAVVDRLVDKHVSSLRKKLLNHSDCIQTVTRLGYRFIPKT